VVFTKTKRGRKAGAEKKAAKALIKNLRNRTKFLGVDFCATVELVFFFNLKTNFCAK